VQTSDHITITSKSTLFIQCSDTAD